MFKNSLLRGRILRSAIEAFKKGWKKLHSGELHDLYWSDVISIVESVGMR
jgi:hypothetical protein